MKAGAWLGVLQYAFLGAGILTLGYRSWVWVEARFFQATESRRLDRELLLRNTVSRIRIPLLPASKWGGMVGRLEIPRIGVSVMVVEGTTDQDLRHAVGHIPGTAMPREGGNMGIAGHRDTFFRPLNAIRRSDSIILSTLSGIYKYRVVSTTVVSPEDVSVLSPTLRDSLTLVTCFPFNYVGSAPRRFIVRAESQVQREGD